MAHVHALPDVASAAELLRAIARVLRALAYDDQAPTSGSRTSSAQRWTAREVAFEAPLVERLKAGDSAAFAYLMERHGRRLLLVARRYVRDAHGAEDVVQNVWVNAFRAIASFRGTAQLGTWLHRMTVNAALMALRTRTRRSDRDLVLTDDVEGLAAPEARTPAPDQAVGDAEMLERLRALVPQGSELDLVSRGLSLKKVSALLQVSLNTVKTRVLRQRQALLERLGGRPAL